MVLVVSDLCSSNRSVRVVDVWSHNQEVEQARIHALVRDFPIVAVATSQDVPARALPATLDGSYDAVRASVERVRFAQVGVALASHDSVLALGCVWRFHVGDHASGDPRRLSEALCVCCRAGVLVTRDGAEDVAYVIRHLRGGVLPARREEFLSACNAAFPALYDLKVMAEWTTVGGAEPPLAGRDAFSRFVELVRERKNGVLLYYNAFLSGLGAADTRELMSFKKIAAEKAERWRKMKELFVQLCPGQDPEHLDRLPIC